MFMTIFMRIRGCLILVVILKILGFMILSIEKRRRRIKNEFVGLKSKVYSVDNDGIKKAIGVNKNAVKNMT